MDKKEYIEDTISGAVDSTLQRTIPSGPQFVALIGYVAYILYLVFHAQYDAIISATGYTALLISAFLARNSKHTTATGFAVSGYSLLIIGLPYQHWWEVFGFSAYAMGLLGFTESLRSPAALYHALATETSPSPFMVAFRVAIVAYLSL